MSCFPREWDLGFSHNHTSKSITRIGKDLWHILYGTSQICSPHGQTGQTFMSAMRPIIRDSKSLNGDCSSGCAWQKYLSRSKSHRKNSGSTFAKRRFRLGSKVETATRGLKVNRHHSCAHYCPVSHGCTIRTELDLYNVNYPHRGILDPQQRP
jgi:hypothetical protein